MVQCLLGRCPRARVLERVVSSAMGASLTVRVNLRRVLKKIRAGGFEQPGT